MTLDGGDDQGDEGDDDSSEKKSYTSSNDLEQVQYLNSHFSKLFIKGKAVDQCFSTQNAPRPVFFIIFDPRPAIEDLSKRNPI